MNWIREFFFAVIAMFLLLLAVPLLPTAIMIQVKDLTVTAEQEVFLTRTVTVPTDGLYTYEIMQGDRLLPECNRSGQTFYEARGLEPINYTLNCSPLPEGEYEMRMCVTAVAVAGIRLRPHCENADFTVGPTYEMRQQALEDQIIMLEELVQDLKGD